MENLRITVGDGTVSAALERPAEGWPYAAGAAPAPPEEHTRVRRVGER